jgi:hypothetical protein
VFGGLKSLLNVPLRLNAEREASVAVNPIMLSYAAPGPSSDIATRANARLQVSLLFKSAASFSRVTSSSTLKITGRNAGTRATEVQ